MVLVTIASKLVKHFVHFEPSRPPPFVCTSKITYNALLLLLYKRNKRSFFERRKRDEIAWPFAPSCRTISFQPGGVTRAAKSNLFINLFSYKLKHILSPKSHLKLLQTLISHGVNTVFCVVHLGRIILMGPKSKVKSNHISNILRLHDYYELSLGWYLSVKLKDEALSPPMSFLRRSEDAHRSDRNCIWHYLAYWGLNLWRNGQTEI